MFRKSLLFVLFLLPWMVKGQDQIVLDSLELRLKNATEDTVRLKTLLDISLYYNNTNYVMAAKYARDAGEMAAKAGLAKWEATANGALATIFLHMGDYKNASPYYFKALKYAEAAHDSTRMAAIYNNMGAVHDRLHEYDKALEYYLKGMNYLTKAKNGQPAALPSLYNNIANVYQSKHDIKSGQQYYEKSLAMAIENKNKYMQGIVYNNLGKLHFTDKKEYDKAIDYLLKGLRVRRELGDSGEVAKSYNVLSGYYLDRKNYTAARVATNHAIELGEETGSLEVQKSGYSTLSQLEEALGKHQQSLEAYKVFKALSDSIQNQLASSEITRLQFQYDFEKAEQQRNAELEQTRFRYITTIVILAVGLIIAVLIVMIARNKARQTELKRKNLAQDVEIKNKELTTNVMYLIRKNELINSVAERLLKLQSNLVPENHKVVHDIILELQKEADSDSWKEFELRFHQVHSEFYKNLRQLYPGLSPADEKLCAFLRLNMSSKEIAAITQQSIKSVEVARARLRKKLSLTNTTSNLVTHLSNL